MTAAKLGLMKVVVGIAWWALCLAVAWIFLPFNEAFGWGTAVALLLSAKVIGLLSFFHPEAAAALEQEELERRKRDAVSLQKPDGSFFTSAAGSRFNKVHRQFLTRLFVPLALLCVAVIGFQAEEISEQELYWFGGSLTAGLASFAWFLWRFFRTPRKTQAYAQFALYRDCLVFMPGAVKVPYVDIEQISLRSSAAGKNIDAYVAVIRHAGSEYVFEWEGSGGEIETVLGFLGFEGPPYGSVGLSSLVGGDIERHYAYNSAKAPADADFHIENGVLAKEVNPLYVVLIFSVLGVLFYLAVRAAAAGELSGWV